MGKFANSARSAALGAVFIAAHYLTAFAAPTAGLDGDVYYVDVPAGETVSDSDASWSSWVSAASGHPFAKRGEGTLKAGAAMASFAGEIRIENGVYAVMTDDGLGTTAGGTVVSNNATLLITGGVSNGAFGYNGAHQNEKFYFSGNGCANGRYSGINIRGALYMWSPSKQLRYVSLLGDATFCGQAFTVCTWGGTLNLNGHELTLALSEQSQPMQLLYGQIPTMGNVTVESGSIQFAEQRTVSGGSEWTLRIKKNAVLYTYNTYQYNNNGLQFPWRLQLDDGAIVRNARSNLVWSGPATVSGTASIVRQEDSWGQWFKGLTIGGILSGNGAFDVQRGQFLSVTNVLNDFAGSIALNGVNATTNSTLKISNNALPATSAGVTMNYGNVELNGSVCYSGIDTNKFSLPKLTCTSSGSVSCKGTIEGSGNRHTVKEIAKSGSGVLTLSGPLCVTGLTEVAAGTLRLGSRIPAVETGLECYFLDVVHSPYYNPNANSGPWKKVSDGDNPPFSRQAGYWNNSSELDTTLVELPYMGIDTNGISLAYTDWPVKQMDVVYRGYLWVDGDEPVTWNFAANIYCACWLRIDGQTVISNINIQRPGIYDRLSTSKAITLSPGAHQFVLYMATYFNPTKIGPATGGDWAPHMGVAYNPNPGAVISSNSTDYVKFTASQFSPTLNRGKADIDSGRYRASFEGGAKFAAGTVFDIGDVAPYTPFTIENLEGAMTVTNGTLVLSGNWKIDAADINAGGLVLAGDANLVFADGATLTVTNGGEIANVHRDGMPLVTCSGTGSVTGKPRILTDEDGWKIDEIDGNINIHQSVGFIIILR